RHHRRAHPAQGRGAPRPRSRPARQVSPPGRAGRCESRHVALYADSPTPVAAMPRLFTGLEIPAAIGESLSTLRGGLPGARWVEPENYHVTLPFIGDVDDSMAHEVASVLGRVRRQSFELRVEDLKSFGGRKPRAVVAALGPAAAVTELQAEHERLMQLLG